MILIPGKCIYLCTPATGSRSTAKALLEQCGGIQLSKFHHAQEHEIKAQINRSEPFYSMLRNPYDFVLSRFWYQKRGSRKDLSLSELIQELPSPIAVYRKYVDRYFLFEKGLRAFFDELGFFGISIPEEGTQDLADTSPRLTFKDIDQKAKQLIDTKFRNDVELYRHYVNS